MAQHPAPALGGERHVRHEGARERGLNCSELDGWWAEVADPELGWSLDSDADDVAAAERLFALLEREIVPEFYDRDDRGVPRRWVARVRASMYGLTGRYSADRTVREYTERYYLPLAGSFRRRLADRRLAEAVDGWREACARSFPAITLTRRRAEPAERRTDGRHELQVHLHLAGLGSGDVAVEAYAEGPTAADPPIVVRLGPGERLVGTLDGYAYRGLLPGDVPLEHYTARVVPCHGDARVPAENAAIRWLG